MSKFFRSIGLGLLGLGVVACSNNDENNAVDNNAQLGQKSKVQVALMDAPGNYQEVFIDLVDVEVKQDSSWASLDGFLPEVIDLMLLVGGTQENLGSIDLNGSEFGEIRLILGPNNQVLVDSVYEELNVPSGSSSGLKIKIKDSLVAGVNYKLTIDFDVAKSVVEAGNSGKYNLKPVLRGYLEQTEGPSAFGTIEGVVSPNYVSAISAITAGDTISTYTDSLGNYKFALLDAGNYAISGSTYLDSSQIFTNSLEVLVVANETVVADTLFY
ncbi:MAG: hypothetical protein ACI9YL_000492 [Luteibaculaceae bacterium]|jgi:hypothetical protein